MGFFNKENNKIMTKPELIAQMAQLSGCTQAESSRNLNALVDIITNQLVEGKELQIADLGKFSTHIRHERNGVNPKTGDAIVIPEMRQPKFKAAKSLRTEVAI